MRPGAGLLLIIVAACGAGQAQAHPRHPVRTSPAVISALSYRTLMNAAFVRAPAPAAPRWTGASAIGFSPTGTGSLRSPGQSPPVAPGPARGSNALGPGAPYRAIPAFSLPDQRLPAPSLQPGAWTASSARYDVDFAPQAGLDWTNSQNSAQAGGTLRLALRRPTDGEHPFIGFRAGHAPAAADRSGRFFLFAAASGQVVGFNMGGSILGGAPRSIWASPGGETLISDAQAGLGWRKGPMQASLGYVHRDVYYDGAANPLGPRSVRDSMVGVSFSLQP